MPSRPIQPLWPFCPLHVGVFLYFDILFFLNLCILQVCIFVFFHFISEPLHSAIMFILYCTLPSWALSPLFRDAFIHHRLPFFTACLSLKQYWNYDWWMDKYSIFHIFILYLHLYFMLSYFHLMQYWRNDWRLDKYRQVGRRKWVLIEGQVANLRDRRTGIGL